MVKYLVILMLVLTSVACTPSYEDSKGNFTALPEELKNCKIYDIQGRNGNRITVMRCPNSEVTTRMSNKAKTTIVVN